MGRAVDHDIFMTLMQTLQTEAGELTHNSAHWLEDQRMQRALGRPTTRVILDRSDRVILNIGELITHDAIERAKQAGVLGILLNSVYVKQPQLSYENQKAPTPSLAAL